LATLPLAGFLNLSAASISLRRPTVFRWVAFLGFHPSGVCSSHQSPGQLVAVRHALLTLFP
jgi:hypothetical protein